MDQTTVSIKRNASDKKAGLTVAELEAFRLDLEHAGIASTTHLVARIGWRGQIASIEASA